MTMIDRHRTKNLVKILRSSEQKGGVFENRDGILDKPSFLFLTIFDMNG